MKFNNNYIIGENVVIGKNVRIGDRTEIYDNVVIGDNTTICNDCIIGEPENSYYSDKNYKQKVTIIGSDSLVRSHTIIYSGVSIGSGFQTGHRVVIREGSVFGEHCSVGTSSDVQGDSVFGDYCRLHSKVFVAKRTKLGNFVFVYPNAIFTDDPTPPSNEHKGPEVGDFSQISSMAIILPGIVIGEHALVGASSVVTKNVNDYSLVAGNPAKHIKDVREIISRATGEHHYPWPKNFSNRMPWADVGYEVWLNS